MRIGRCGVAVEMRSISVGRYVQSASSSGLAEKSVDNAYISVRLFVGWQVTALLEDYEPRSGNRLIDLPCGDRSNVHIVASGDDHRRKFKLWEFRRQVERSRCLLHCGGDLRHRFEVLDAGEVSVAIRFAVEEHEEVIADALIGSVGAGGVLFAGRDLLEYIGEYIRKYTHDVLPSRRSGVAENEFLDVFGVCSGVGHSEQAAVGVADEVKLLEAELRTDCLHVGNLRVHTERSVGRHALGLSGTALIVEDDLAIVR